MPRILFRAVTLSTWVVWAALCVAFIAGLVTRQYSLSFVALGTFVLTLLPLLFARRFHLYVPRRFMGFIILFIFATLFLGEVGDFYERYWWWDVVLHGGSALGFGLIAFLAVFMLFQGDRYAAPPWAIGLLAFCLAVSIGALWEVFEFVMDESFGLNMQKTGLRDTMWDLIVDAIGGLIGAGAGAFYMRATGRTLFSNFFADFITRNGRFFSKFRSK